METFLKTAAAIFAILFIGTTALSLALYSVEASAFDAELYIRAMEEENVYQRLPELTAQSLALAAQRSEGNPVMSLLRSLSEEQWRVFVVDLFPPEILKVLAEDAVTQMMAYLNGERENVILSLAGLKAHLVSPDGINTIYGMLQSQPDCTVEQLTAMAMGQADLMLCNPPESFLFVDLRPVYEAEIGAALTLLPEQATLFGADENRIQRLRDLKALRLLMRLSPLPPLLFLLLMTVLAVRSLKDWLSWWGYPLLLAGLFSMSLGALSGPMASLTFQIFIATALPDFLPQGIVNLFRELTAVIVRNALRPTLLVAGLMAFFGLVMVVLTFLLRQRLQKNSLYVR